MGLSACRKSRQVMAEVVDHSISAERTEAPAGSDRVQRLTARLSGGLSLAMGLVLAYRLGVVDGLFSGAPHWAPR